MNRRELWKMALAAAFTSGGERAGLASDLKIPIGIKERSATGGDLAILNARLWTMDPQRPRAQAALVRGGRIVLAGSNADVRAS